MPRTFLLLYIYTPIGLGTFAPKHYCITQQGNQPASQPASRPLLPASQCASQPARHPASQLPSQPAKQQASKPANKLARQLGSQAGRQASRQAASQSQQVRQPTSQLTYHPDDPRAGCRLWELCLYCTQPAARSSQLGYGSASQPVSYSNKVIQVVRGLRVCVCGWLLQVNAMSSRNEWQRSATLGRWIDPFGFAINVMQIACQVAVESVK